MPGPWLRFSIDETSLVIPLRAVAEVTLSAAPRLIPLVPLSVGGILNVRGEPLPVVDGGVLISQQPSRSQRRVLVLDHLGARVGVLVTHVSRIERELDRSSSYQVDSRVDEPHVQWRNEGERELGILDPEALFERATELLKSKRSPMGEEPCQSAF